MDLPLNLSWESIALFSVGYLAKTIIPQLPGSIGWVVGQFTSGQNRLLDYVIKDNEDLRNQLKQNETEMDALKAQLSSVTHELNQLKLAVGFKKEAEERGTSA